MKPSPQAVKVHRLLGALAVVHGLALLALFRFTEGSLLLERLWCGLTTLWFFWPLVLAAHSGRGIKRFLVPVIGASILFWPIWQMFSVVAPIHFGVPFVMRMTPRSLVRGVMAYHAGRLEAKKDIRNGRLIVEECGLGAGVGPHVTRLQEKYGIEIRATAQCIVDEQILGHLAGYNSISEPEIARRFGATFLASSREEGYREMAADRTREEEQARELARGLTTLPPESPFRLESVACFSYKAPLEQNLPSDELKRLVKYWENSLSSEYQNVSESFEFNVRSKITPAAPPENDTSAASDHDAYYRVYERRNSGPDIRSQTGEVNIYLKFVSSHRPQTALVK